MVPLDDVPVVALDRLAQERRSLELVADELRPLRGDDEETDERVVLRDPGVATEERLAEHRRPLDLEEERRATADVPDAVDLGDVVDGPADLDEVGPMLALVEPVPEPSRSELARLLAAPDPDAHPEPVAAVGEERDRLGVLLRPAEEIVAGQHPVRRARHAPVALEAGPDEGFVRQVVAGEQRRDPLEERGLGERAGGRQEAVDGPLDAVGEGRGRGGAVGRVGEPPAARLDLREPSLVRPAQLVVDQREQCLDLVRRRVGWPGRPARASRGRSAGRAAWRAVGLVVAVRLIGTSARCLVGPCRGRARRRGRGRSMFGHRPGTSSARVGGDVGVRRRIHPRRRP